VISGQLEVKPGGQLVEECTVFNSDIRGFTRMSESTPPEVLVEMLNEYFELMVDTIFKYEGTLDKFMGDGIMALWGAPVQHPDDAVRSVVVRAGDGRGAGQLQPPAHRARRGAARGGHRHPHRSRSSRATSAARRPSRTR
jgi:class 3 adenylate cyclase